MRTDLLVGVTALVLGCGSGPIGGDDELGEDSESEDTGETEVGETETETDTETDTETGDGDGDVCVTAEGTLGPAVLRLDWDADRAWVIDGASELELAIETPAGESPWLIGAAAGDRIAVARNVGTFGQDQQATIHAFDRTSGQLEWTRELQGVGASLLWVADDGWITGITNPSEPGQPTGFAMNDDETITLDDTKPLAAARDGWLAAQQLGMDGTASAVGWIALADQSWTPAEPATTNVNAVWIGEDDHTHEYVAAGGLGPVFIRARADGSEVFDLPVDQLPSDNVVVFASAGDFRLLRAIAPNDPNDENSVFIRVDVESSEAILVDPEPPTDWTWFDCYSRSARITAEGAVLFELHDDSSARVWAFEPEAEQWSEVGLQVGMVDDIEFVGEFGNVVAVHASAQFQTFCPQLEWNEPPVGALLGESMQLFRDEPALAISIPTMGNWWQVQVDEQERCVVYAYEESWRVRALDGEAELGFGPSTGTWLWID